MRDASGELYEFIEYCKMILNAETEEEVEVIRGQIPQNLKELGYSDERINTYMNQIEVWLEWFENSEMSIQEVDLMVNVLHQEARNSYYQSKSDSLQKEGNSYYQSKLGSLQEEGNSYYQSKSDSMQENSETLQPTTNDTVSSDYNTTGIAIGLSGAVLIGCIALKKKALKNKKNKGL